MSSSEQDGWQHREWPSRALLCQRSRSTLSPQPPLRQLPNCNTTASGNVTVCTGQCVCSGKVTATVCEVNIEENYYITEKIFVRKLKQRKSFLFSRNLQQSPLNIECLLPSSCSVVNTLRAELKISSLLSLETAARKVSANSIELPAYLRWRLSLSFHSHTGEHCVR